MGKNIVIFSDGTGQTGGVGTNTNVYKIFNMIEDRTQRQIAYYDPGLGTDAKKITGSIAGRGFSKNMLECYRFIFEHFEADDKIFLFGFSRGAATVRSLSGFLHLFGVLPQSRPELIKQAFRIYKIRNEERRKRKAEEFIGKHHTMWCTVRLLGVFDTVAALGLPNPWISFLLDKFFPHRFHSFGLSDSVEYARHALSIDEERKTFLPTLWEALKENKSDERLKQVWFCGVHTDVGGGYPEEDLSNISLAWMLNEAIGKGLIIYPKSPAWKKILAESPDIDGKMHNELTHFPGKLFRRTKRAWDESKHGKLCLHESVLKRKRNNANELPPEYEPWIKSFTDPAIEKWEKLTEEIIKKVSSPESGV
jgi:uncharacterized protein (DUF2235 family)